MKKTAKLKATPKEVLFNYIHIFGINITPTK